jgi:hypothetical protein
MKNWDGKDYDALAKGVLQNGGSGNAAVGIQQHALQIKETASKIAQQDAETGSKNLDTVIQKHDQILGALDAAKNVPDAQLGAHVMQTVQQLQQNGMLSEPAIAQQAQQLSQLPPDQMRTQLDNFEKNLKGSKQQFADAKSQAESYKDTAEGNEANAKVRYGAPVEQQELQSYLTTPSVPGEKLAPPQRTPASFLAWKAKQNPTAAIVTSNMLGGNNAALDQAAQRYSQTGELPAGFARSPGTTAAIIKRSAELHPDQDLASNKATFSADTAALKKVQTQFDSMTAFEGTALKNLDLYAETAKKIPDLGAKFANVPLRMITGNMIGTDNMAALNAARQTASSEVAKVLSSATGSGVLSDSQKKEAEDVINGNLPLSATLKVVATLKQDMANRHQSYQDDVDAIRGRMGAKPQSTTTTGGMVTMRAPNGATKQVSSDQVEHYKSLGATVITQ